MKAVIYDKCGPPSVLKVTEVPKPSRRPNQVLVALSATSVNPVDAKLRYGQAPPRPIAKFPKIPGGDVAGVVVEAPENSSFKPGDKVFALTEGFSFKTKDGTYAEYASIPLDQLAIAPQSISLVEAAAVPLVSLTAYQALRPAKLSTGQRVLIHAGAGGVSHVAIQLAKMHGCHVSTTCSPGNFDFVKGLGADEVIDYHSQKFEEVCRDRPFDVIFDPIGGRNYEIRGFKVLKKSGIYISIFTGLVKNTLHSLWMMSSSKILSTFGLSARYHFNLMVKPNGRDLEHIAKLIDEGKLRVVVDKTFPLEEAAAAHTYIESGKGRKGKIVLIVKNA